MGHDMRCASDVCATTTRTRTKSNVLLTLFLLLAGTVYRVVEFLHVKPGKGSAFVRTKLKNLTTGG